MTKVVSKCSLAPELGVHGQEVVDTATGDRLAHRSRSDTAIIDVEEMFVSPDFAAKATEEIWQRSCGVRGRMGTPLRHIGCRSLTMRPMTGNRYLLQHACWRWSSTRHRKDGPDTWLSTESERILCRRRAYTAAICRSRRTHGLSLRHMVRHKSSAAGPVDVAKGFDRERVARSIMEGAR